MMGPAVVALPLLFQQAGWLTPTIFIVFAGVCSAFASTMLVEAMQKIPVRRPPPLHTAMATKDPHGRHPADPVPTMSCALRLLAARGSLPAAAADSLTPAASSTLDRPQGNKDLGQRWEFCAVVGYFYGSRAEAGVTWLYNISLQVKKSLPSTSSLPSNPRPRSCHPSYSSDINCCQTASCPQSRGSS